MDSVKPENINNKNLSKDSTKIFQLGGGKLPPQALDLERAVLGALLIDNISQDKIELLSLDVFYKKENRLVFEAIQELFNESKEIDLLSVAEKLRSKGYIQEVGGESYLINITQDVFSSAHFEYHAKIITEKYILRKLIEISSNMIEKAYDQTSDVFDLLDACESNLFEITNGTLKKNFSDAKSLISDTMKRIKDSVEKKGISGVPSGFKKLDNITAGWQPSDLIIIAARPSMGKTAFILSMARNIAVDYKIPVGLFSLEMSAEQLMIRMISNEAEIDSEKLRKGDLLNNNDWKKLASLNDLENAELYIDDSPGISIFDFRAKARRLVSSHGVKVIFIDYLQLMTSGAKNAGNREQEISNISRTLKAVAKELNIPIIALSQLSRMVEARTGTKRPILSDLRESGAIEQDADIVGFIYRPEYYKFETWEDDTPCEGQAELIISKHRNGSLGDVRLKFTGRYTRFEDLNYDLGLGYNKGELTYESSLNVDSKGMTIDSSINNYSSDASKAFGLEQDKEGEDSLPF